MEPAIPAFLVTFNALLLPLSLISGLGLIWLGHARLSPRRLYLPLALSALLLAWFAIALAVGRAGFYAPGAGLTIPTLPLGLLLPLILAFAGVFAAAPVRTLIDAIPLSWLVAAQYYRAGGVVFLILLAGGHLPWEFALPAGIGDLLTGIFAVIVGLSLTRVAARALWAARAWNLFGILDLVLAVALGTLTSPGITGLVSQDAPNLLITAWPLVMIPTFAVPLSLILHGLTAWKIARTARAPATKTA